MNISNCRGGLLGLCTLLLPILAHAQQLKLGAAPAVIEKSALLDLNSDKQGLLLPRINDFSAAPLNAAPDGMLIYNVPDKLLYIRKNGIWRKLIDETNGITSVNGQTGPAVTLTTNNIAESVNLYYTDTRARAAFSAGTGIAITGAGVISALNTTAIWNASQLQGRNISSAAPANNDVLTWDNASSTWLPKAPTAAATITLTGDVTGSGTSSIATTLANSGVTAGTYPKVTVDAKGRVTAGSALSAGDIPAGSGSYIQNISSGTQTASYAISGNGSLGGTFTLSSMTPGSVLFAGTGGLVSQKNTNLFWDNTNNRLGLGTTTPGNTLEVAGTVAATGVSGLRLKDLGTATVQAYNSKVLSINSTGDVIVTANAAASNWLVTGNSNVDATTQFLGTTDDNKMVLKSNNTSLLEFGRRQTLGLTQNYTDYTDDNEMVTYMKSALQFAVPSTVNFYKPKMWTTSDGNFRMKGCSAGTDYFEFGATGTSNNGGFEFIIGDDGDEPITFKSYNYVTTAFTEIMRLQNNKVGIGLAGATPVKPLHVNAANDALRVENLAASGTGNPLVIAGNGDIKQTTALDGVSIGATTQASGSFTTLAVETNTITLGTTNNDIAIGNASFIRITGPNAAFSITSIAGGFDGRMVTLYNTTNQNMTLQNNTGGTATNRILTLGAAATTGTGTITLVYSSADSRWIVTAVNP